MSSKRYNIGIIGYGLSAKVFHLPLILSVPDFKLHAIVQRSPKVDDNAEHDHPAVKVWRSAEEMVRDETLDVVVVTTAPDTHFSLAKLALEGGKHVVVEKPFTPTSQEGDELITIAKKHQRLLTVYHNRRWDSDFLTLSKYIGNGSLGRVVEFETHFDRYRPEVAAGGSWKLSQPAGAVIYDLGTHLIDQVVHLYGLPKKVTGLLYNQREHNPSEFEDSCTILLHYDGLLVTVKASVVSPELNQLRFWVRGDKGSFKKYHLDCQEDQLKAGMKPGDHGYGLEPKERYGVLTVVKAGQIESEVVPTVEPATYAEFYRKFARALGGDSSQLPVDPAAAAAVIRLVELAKQSSKQGRTLDV